MRSYVKKTFPADFSKIISKIFKVLSCNWGLTVQNSVGEPHHFYAAPAPGENFDAAPATPAPAPTLLLHIAGPTFFFLLILCYQNFSKYA
jgi:hypothetical protein